MSKTTTSRGLGGNHQKQRERLLRGLVNGTPCWWCTRPMYRTPHHNWDTAPLEADHSKSRRDHGPQELADRLLHRWCNRQRGAGDHDNHRPAVIGVAPEDWKAPPTIKPGDGFQTVTVTFH